MKTRDKTFVPSDYLTEEEKFILSIVYQKIKKSKTIEEVEAYKFCIGLLMKNAGERFFNKEMVQ